MKSMYCFKQSVKILNFRVLISQLIGMADSTLELTEGQLKILKLAESGHNICVVGKAGVGKGKKCFIVCASGVACDPYNGAAKTVHKFTYYCRY